MKALQSQHLRAPSRWPWSPHTRRLRPAAVLAAGLLAAGSAGSGTPLAIRGDRLPPLPDPEGYAGSFAGVTDGRLLVAGGANFPGRKPWEGGKKVWHDPVFLLDRPEGPWKRVGRLPRPLAYGVSVTHRGSVVCAGGSDAGRHHADTFRLTWSEGRLRTTALPPLPVPVANGCGALVGDRLYLAGGQRSPDVPEALRDAWVLDLSRPNAGWKRLPPIPGPGRILAAAAGGARGFFVVGGADLAPGPDGAPVRRYLRDGYLYRPDVGWSRIADLPHPVAAAPSPAPEIAGGFLLLGGSDGSRDGDPPQHHPGFPTAVLRYHRSTDRWTRPGTLPAARVTVPCVRWRGRWVIPSGEVRPGVRSPEVWSFRIPNER